MPKRFLNNFFLYVGWQCSSPWWNRCIATCCCVFKEILQHTGAVNACLCIRSNLGCVSKFYVWFNL